MSVHYHWSWEGYTLSKNCSKTVQQSKCSCWQCSQRLLLRFLDTCTSQLDEQFQCHSATACEMSHLMLTVCVETSSNRRNLLASFKAPSGLVMNSHLSQNSSTASHTGRPCDVMEAFVLWPGNLSNWINIAVHIQTSASDDSNWRKKHITNYPPLCSTMTEVWAALKRHDTRVH